MLAKIKAAEDEGVLRSISASYFWLRRGLGFIGFALPVALILWVGIDNIQTSISAYYHYSETAPNTYGAGTARDLFVGVLWAMGTFLFFYKGYSWKEDVALDIAGLAVIGVAMFPTDWPRSFDVVRTPIGLIHFSSAVIFFLAIAYVCLFRAKDTLKYLDEQRRRRFKRIYVLLGVLMVALPALVVLIHWLSQRPERSLYVLLVEIAGVYVFSAFWLVKSREIAIIRKPK